MSRVTAQTSAIIPAPLEQIYAVLADYRNEHPHVLPKAYFSNLEIEQGGQGAGTVFRMQTHVMGVKRDFHMIVTEPIPGRQLVETDLETGLETTFSLAPTSNPQETKVTIRSSWAGSPGLAGLIDRWTTPPIMRRMFKQELVQLANYVRRRQPQTA